MATYKDGMSLAECLQLRIDRARVSRPDAARALDIDASTLWRWLKGGVPATEKAPALAKFLEITEDRAALLIHSAEKRRRSVHAEAAEAIGIADNVTVEVTRAPALHSKLDRLSERDRQIISEMVDRLLGEDE